MFAPYLLKKRAFFTSVADAASEYTKLNSAIPLGAGQRACMSSVTVTSNSAVAAFELSLPPSAELTNPPPLEATLSAPTYYQAVQLPSGTYGKRIEFPIHAPRHSVIVTACLLNAGTHAIELEGTTAGRTTSRSALTIGGRRVVGNITLGFLPKRPRSRLARLGETFEHVSNLTDRLIPVWLVWILSVLTVLTVPIGIVVALQRALREDDAVS
jgi:hypothetical protein